MSLGIKIGDQAAFIAAYAAACGPDSPAQSLTRADLKRLLISEARDSALFTAHHNGDSDAGPIGRIMVHASPSGSPAQGPAKSACFHHFDCADDPDAAKALLDIASGWARARGLTRILGNVAPFGLPALGVLCDGYALAPALGQVWSAPHMIPLLAENGFTPAGMMEIFQINPQTAEPPRVGPAQQNILDNPDFYFSPPPAAGRQNLLAGAEAVLNLSISQAAPFVAPFTLTGQHSPISAVLHYRDRPIACCLCLQHPSPALFRSGTGQAWGLFNRRTGPRDVVLWSGVVKEFQGFGIIPLLLRRVLLALKAEGFTSVSTHCTADLEGLDIAQSGVIPMHRLHLFGKVV